MLLAGCRSIVVTMPPRSPVKAMKSGPAGPFGEEALPCPPLDVSLCVVILLVPVLASIWCFCAMLPTCRRTADGVGWLRYPWTYLAGACDFFSLFLPVGEIGDLLAVVAVSCLIMPIVRSVAYSTSNLLYLLWTIDVKDVGYVIVSVHRPFFD